ncbi:hypothetical protein J1605_007587 [Eschrichtius robustus]|uniref:Uncharacterized protein n=1 Tax=Eschrichtius robustus TaxID=9764 RepID=A0AB34H1T4_ESCRO|nr:hypothetical protein J1605_007587 [Eschrichtius robustus]
MFQPPQPRRSHAARPLDPPLPASLLRAHVAAGRASRSTTPRASLLHSPFSAGAHIAPWRGLWKSGGTDCKTCSGPVANKRQSQDTNPALRIWLLSSKADPQSTKATTGNKDLRKIHEQNILMGLPWWCSG